MMETKARDHARISKDIKRVLDSLGWLQPDVDPALVATAYNGLYGPGKQNPITEDDVRWYFAEKAARQRAQGDEWLFHIHDEELVIAHIRHIYGLREPLVPDADPQQLALILDWGSLEELDSDSVRWHLSYRAACRYVAWKRAGMPHLEGTPPDDATPCI
jgi:hypothetical protein